jgi:hypothetical protein
VCTFSNRCFPTKAIRGWLATDDRQHCAIVRENQFLERALAIGDDRHRQPRGAVFGQEFWDADVDEILRRFRGEPQGGGEVLSLSRC